MKKYYAVINCGLSNPLYQKEVEVTLTGHIGLRGSVEVTTVEPVLMPQCRVNVKTNEVAFLEPKLERYTNFAKYVREEEI